ncbi:MAG: elongation factor G [Phycisphaerales bacterium]|nr:elongation factor G [Phycisphaerales bacterium]
MAVRNPSDIRNIVLLGTGGSGKTTLTERLLLASGAIKRMGTVEEGSTVSDWTEGEKHHKHSLSPSAVHFDFHGHTVNLLDTPGLVDFLGHAIASLPAAETAVIVVDALRGIDSTTRRLMQIAGERGLPRLIVVNKMESHDADLGGLVERLREAFGPVCLPINLPKADRSGVIDAFEHADAADTPMFSSVPEAHKAIIEQVVEVDEDLMSEYLEHGDKLPPERVHAAFEKALEDGHLVPVCFCSAKSGAGAEDLLHIFADLLPSPTEVSLSEFVVKGPEGTDVPFTPKPDPSAKVVAHVFKVTSDPFVGKLAFFRVHQGTVRHKSELLLSGNKKPLRITHIFKVQGKDHAEVSEIGPGDIGAVSKLDELHFNGVLHEAPEHESLRVRPLPMPRPMFGQAIELKNHADEAKFSTACAKLRDEDPGLSVDRVAATKQTVLSGMGELHLRVVLEKLKGSFGIDVITSKPKTPYKETITTKAEGHHRHKKQTGGAGQFGEVYLRIEPLPAGHPEGFEFVSEVVGGAVPRQYWPAVEKGVRQAIEGGAIAGYPMTGVRVALYDGKYHDVDSKEIAFITAGRKAFVDAVQKARPKLLEPFVNVEVTAPSKYLGDLAGHMSTKRGRVQDTMMMGEDVCVVRAQAPLGELQNYSNELKSMTGGAGTFTMEYSHDEHTPAHIQQEVVAAFKPKTDEE